MEIVKLDDPNLIINKRFNAGKRHGYLLTRAEGWVNHSSLHVFESDGPLILLDNRSPDEREAHLNDHPFCADGMPAITATFTALMARSSGDTAPLIETSSLNLEGTTFGIWLWRKLQNGISGRKNYR